MALRGIDVDDVPVAYVLEDVPDADIAGAMLRFTSGRAADHHVWVSGRSGDHFSTGIGQEEFEHLRKVEVGDEVLVDNAPYLAFQTYHRHQVPSTDEWPEWDQFRAAGKPVYPQRPQLLGPRFVRNNGAGQMNGRFAGKMIVVQSLFDEIAYPQQADWYRRRVSSVLGDRADDQYRVWFTDHAMHQDPAVMPQVEITPHRSTRIINYRGVLEQALRDLAAWVERGSRALRRARTTRTSMVRSSSPPPPRNAAASSRSCTSPRTVASALDVVVGEPVGFEALVEVPPGAGTIVAGEWDFEGTGDFPVVEPFTNEDVSYTSMTITREYAFAAPRTYFPALRVTAQRLGQADNPHGRVMNLGRVRVVVG